MLNLLESVLTTVWNRAGAGRKPSTVRRKQSVDESTIGITFGPVDEETGERPGKPVHLDWKDLVRHTVIVGQTGSGKSTLLRRICERFAESVSIVSFDIHGDFNRNWLLPHAASILSSEVGAKRLVVIDPAISDRHIVSVNPLAGDDEPLQRAFRIAGILREQADSWGVTIDQNLTYCLVALCEAGDSLKKPFALVHVEPFFTHEAFRLSVCAKCSEPVRNYWVNSFGSLSQEQALTSWRAVENKLTRLVLPLHDLLAPRQGFSFNCLNEAPPKIVLCTLLHHRLDSAAVSGMDLLVGSFAGFVMARAELPSEEKCPVLAIVDEFPLLDTSRFESLLALARKHNVAVVLGAQSFGQLSTSTKHVLRNVVGNTIAMRVGPDSAKDLARSILPRDPDEDVEKNLLSFRQGEAYLQQVDKPAVKFRVRHAPDPEVTPAHQQQVLEASMQAFGVTRIALKKELTTFHNQLQRMEQGETVTDKPTRRRARTSKSKEVSYGPTVGAFKPKE
jgi:hypothetical protein